MTLEHAVDFADRWLIQCPDCNGVYITRWRRHLPRFCIRCKGTRPQPIAACQIVRDDSRIDIENEGTKYRLFRIEGAAEKVQRVRNDVRNRMLKAAQEAGVAEGAADPAQEEDDE